MSYQTRTLLSWPNVTIAIAISRYACYIEATDMGTKTKLVAGITTGPYHPDIAKNRFFCFPQKNLFTTDEHK